MEMKYTTIWECTPFIDSSSLRFFLNFSAIYKRMQKNVFVFFKDRTEKKGFQEQWSISHINRSKSQFITCKCHIFTWGAIPIYHRNHDDDLQGVLEDLPEFLQR